MQQFNHRENYLKTVRFERPERIPMSFHINSSCYEAYDHDFLFEQMEAHPLLFPNFQRPKQPFQIEYGGNSKAGVDYVDGFGCVWQTSANGITGTVTGHPLLDWKNYENYVFPSPETNNGLEPIDWTKITARIQAAKKAGELTTGGLRHGHTFLQLCDMRGYQNLLFDMVDEEPLLFDLIEKLEEFNHALIRKYLALDVDVVTFAEDLGMQKGPMLSPDQFKRFIKPSYQRMMESARKQDCIVHMHSDGDIRQLVDDLIEGGVQIINLQDLVNGIDWIHDRFHGKVCIELDIDRQSVTAFGTPKEIEQLIRQEVTTLGGKDGGLMMIYGLYPGIPKENVVALMDAMERYSCYY